ncbi:MAG: 6-phosphogluconolactonase [Tsuneonella sp.]
MTVTMIEDADDHAIAAWVAERIERALAPGGPIAITVPGGSTPFPILEPLARLPLDWRRVAVWPGDERVVPEDHPASNAGRIRALLDPVGAEVVTLTVMEQVPRFALAWLGMGADGHVASLFPSSDPRADDPLSIRRLTPEPLPPEAPFDRVSLTIPALVASETLMFVIRGAEKRALFREAAEGRNDLPVARLLAAAQGPVTCFT